MKVSILILLSCSISFLLSCASAPTKSLLEERAGYGVNAPPLSSVGTSGGVRYAPSRVPEKVVVGWLHAHDLAAKTYFWGSWLSIVVEDERWEMKKVEVPKSDKSKSRRTEDRPVKQPPKRISVNPRPST